MFYLPYLLHVQLVRSILSQIEAVFPDNYYSTLPVVLLHSTNTF